MQPPLEKLFKSVFIVVCNSASPGADQHIQPIPLAVYVQNFTMATYNDSYPLPRNPIPPISIVDIFFPGFTNISAAFQQLQSSNTSGFAQMLCICGIALFFGRYPYNSVKEFVNTYLSPYLPKVTGDTFWQSTASTVHISDTDEVYNMLVAWISSQPFFNKASSTIVSVGKRKRRFAGNNLDRCIKKPL